MPVLLIWRQHHLREVCLVHCIREVLRLQAEASKARVAGTILAVWQVPAKETACVELDAWGGRQHLQLQPVAGVDHSRRQARPVG